MILILMVEGARAVISLCIPSCPVAPPCTPELLTVCRRRLPLWLPPPLRSRSLLPLRESTLYGSVAPSWPLCPPSSRCGSQSRSTTSVDPPLSTASASKQLVVRSHSDFLFFLVTYFAMFSYFS